MFTQEMSKKLSATTTQSGLPVQRIHDNGPAARLTAGASEDTEENSSQKCIDGPTRVISRD